MLRHLRFLVASALLALGSCSISPIPEPPSAAPRLSGDVEVIACSACDTSLRLQAVAGTAIDATEIWVADLDNSAVPKRVPVAQDGSFQVDLVASVDDQIRFQALRGTARSEPLDLVLHFAGKLTPAPRPFASCFQAPFNLDFGDAAVGVPAARSVVLQHACSTPLTVTRLSLRSGATGFGLSVAAALPLVWAAGSPLTVELSHTASSTGLDEDVVLLDVSSPDVDRRAIVLSAGSLP